MRHHCPLPRHGNHTFSTLHLQSQVSFFLSNSCMTLTLFPRSNLSCIESASCFTGLISLVEVVFGHTWRDFGIISRLFFMFVFATYEGLYNATQANDISLADHCLQKKLSFSQISFITQIRFSSAWASQRCFVCYSSNIARIWCLSLDSRQV